MKNYEIKNAYMTLKGLNLRDMSEEVMNAIWDNIKVLRPLATEYDTTRTERQNSLYDEKMQKPVEDLLALEEKMRKGYKPKKEEEERMKPVVEYLNKLNKALADLDRTEVEVSPVKIPEKDLLKVLKVNEKSFDDMEILSCMFK